MVAGVAMQVVAAEMLAGTERYSPQRTMACSAAGGASGSKEQ